MESTADIYRYTPLPPNAPHSIRLLSLLPHSDPAAGIQCNLSEYSLVDSNGEGAHLYEALSYVWGDPTDRGRISVNGKYMSITANLHSALRHLRHGRIVRHLWIDAICINQDDDGEKEGQIRLMAEVYSKASRVIVWLGNEDGGVDGTLEALRLLADDENEAVDAEITARMDGIDKPAVLELLRRPWFKRIWVRKPSASRPRLSPAKTLNSSHHLGAPRGRSGTKYRGQVRHDRDRRARLCPSVDESRRARKSSGRDRFDQRA